MRCVAEKETHKIEGGTQYEEVSCSAAGGPDGAGLRESVLGGRCCAAGSATEFGDLTADDADYEPNPDYDKYTVIEYYIEASDATVIITCSAKADDSEFNLEYSFYGDDQQVIWQVVDGEGKVAFDKTGFMGGDAPDMIAYILENATVWADIVK